MDAEAQATPEGVVVFVEQDRGGPACDRLVQALGGQLGGYFRPQRPPQVGRFQWARFYKFADESRAHAALDVLQRAITDGHTDLAEWGISCSEGSVNVDVPRGRGPAIGAAVKRLHEELDYHPDNLPSLVPEQWEKGPNPVTQRKLRVRNDILANWLGCALASYAANPQSNSTVHRGTTQAAPDLAAWLQLLASYCQHHPSQHQEQTLADLTPIADAVWREAWDVARAYAYETRRGPQPFDRAALSALELRIAIGEDDIPRAIALLDTDPIPPMDDPLVLRDAVRARLASGRPDLAGELLASRHLDTSDGEALIQLLGAEVDYAQGWPDRALESTLAARFYRPDLSGERRRFLGRLAIELSPRVAEDEVLAQKIEDMLNRHPETPDREALARLENELLARHSPTSLDTATEISDLEVPAVAVVTTTLPEDRFAEILRVARRDPSRGSERLHTLVDELPGNADAPRWWQELGDLSQQLGEEGNAVRAYSTALEVPPKDQNRRQDPRGAARALTAVLQAGNPHNLSESTLDAWLQATDAVPGQITLLLLRAARCAQAGDVRDAEMLLRKAVPDLLERPSPRIAQQYVEEIQLTEGRARELLMSLARRLRAADGPLGRGIDELVFAVNPLDGDVLMRLVAADYDALDAQAVADRFAQIFERLEQALSADEPPRSRTDVLARLHQPLDYAADALLGVEGLGISTEILTDDLSAALTALMAAGEPERATKLLRRALQGPERLRSSPASLVALADTLYTYETVPSTEVNDVLGEAYAMAAFAIVDRFPQVDRPLLDVVLRTLRGLQPDQAVTVTALLESYDQTVSDRALPQPAPIPEGRRLAGCRIAVVGGDEPVRSRSARELQAYGAEQVIEVPPAYEHALDEREMRAKVGRCHLVLNVWAQTKHQTSDLVKMVVEDTNPRPDLQYVAGTGFSSIVRKALEWADARHGVVGGAAI